MVKKKKVKKARIAKKQIKRKAKTGLHDRKEFEIFAQGIERLKELKNELDSLDTRGFSREEQSIRSKLKNVSDIPRIERELKTLRLKIARKYKPKKRVKSTYEVLRGEIGKIKEKMPKIEKGIEHLTKKVSEKKKIGKIDTDVGVLVDTDFNSFLNDIKTSLSDRIKKKEKEVEDVLKSDLQEREEKFRKKYTNLIREFNVRKRKLEQQLNQKYAKKVKISLQKEISEKFNEKLRRKLEAEKGALRRRYKVVLRQHANEELEKRKQELRKQLEKELERKMEDLEKEEQKKIEDLEKKEKIEISKVKTKERNLKKEEQREKDKWKEEKEKLKKEEQKIEISKRKLKVEEESLKKEEQEEKNRWEKEKEELEKEEQREKDKWKEDKEKLRKAEELFEKRKQEFLEKSKEKIGKEKQELREEFKKDELELQKARERFLHQKELERKRLKEKLVKQFHKKFKGELAKKEKTLRGHLRNEFDLQLKKKIQQHEEYLKKKKFALELAIQRKMKQVLK